MENNILLKDLCARLPYRVKCSFGVDDEIYEICGVNLICCDAPEIQAIHIESGINGDFSLNSCKPYLFPLSSMTKEQCKELYNISEVKNVFTPDIRIKIYNNTIKWFLKNHFDYQGLIPKDLATDATNLNIYNN